MKLHTHTDTRTHTKVTEHRKINKQIETYITPEGMYNTERGMKSSICAYTRRVRVILKEEE